MVNNPLGNCERGALGKKAEGFISGSFCYLDGPWMLFHASCKKNLHLIYEMFVLAGCQNTVIVPSLPSAP